MTALGGEAMRYALLGLVACLLCGCIKVGDFGNYWAGASHDSCLEAIMWKDNPDRHTREEMAELVRTMKIGDAYIMLVKDKAEDKGGELYRYRISDGKMVTYWPDDSKIHAFEKAYPGSGFEYDIGSDGRVTTFTIPVLDEHAFGILKSVVNDESYWKEAPEKDPDTGQERPVYNPDHQRCPQ